MNEGYNQYDRETKLRKIIDGIPEDKREVVEPLVDEIIFLEGRLRELRRLPMIRIHPKNPERQEATPASKQYKEFMQSYINAIKVIQRSLYLSGETGESDLIKALKEFGSNEDIS